MARKFKILSPDYVEWLFVDKYAGSPQYISYRHCIEHALCQLLSTDCTIDECKKSFQEFKSEFDKNHNYPNVDTSSKDIPIRLYWLQGFTDYAVLVDDTKWCYPLVFDTPKRAAGLKEAVNNIADNIDEILRMLNQYASSDKVWDAALQEQMDALDSRKEWKNAA